MTSGIFSNREKKGKFVGNIDISSMDSKNIILEIKNRLEFICDKTAVSKRKLSHILGKPDGYIAHRFSYNDKLNITVLIEIIKIFGLSPSTLFLPQKEDFLATLNDTQIIELKSNALKAYKSIEIQQLIKEIKEISKQLKQDKNIQDYKKILLLNKSIRKLIKLKKILENKKLTTQSEDEMNSCEQLLTQVNSSITHKKTRLLALKS